MDLDPDDFVTIDIGSARSGGDMFKIQNEPNAPALSVAATLLWQYLQFDENRSQRDENRPQPSEDREETDGTKFFHQSCSNPERDKTFTENPELRESIELCQEALQGMRFMTPGTLAFIHYLGARAAGKEIALEFVRAVAAGPNLGLGKDNPAMVLRKRLVESQEKSSTKLSPIFRLVFTIKAFNAFAKGEQIYRLSWTRKGENTEDFPAFVSMDEVLKARRAREQEQPISEEAGQPVSSEAEHVTN